MLKGSRETWATCNEPPTKTCKLVKWSAVAERGWAAPQSFWAASYKNKLIGAERRKVDGCSVLG